MGCCPTTYWCTPDGPTAGTTVGNVTSPPEGATSEPYATFEEAEAACPPPLLSSCEACSFEYRPQWTVSVENVSGIFVAATRVMTASLVNQSGVPDPCSLLGVAWNLPTTRICLAASGGVDAPFTWNLRLFFSPYAWLVVGSASVYEGWLAWSQCFTAGLGVTFQSAGSGFSLETPTDSVLSYSAKTGTYECGSGVYVDERQLLGTVGFVDNSGTPLPLLGTADVYVQR